MADTETPVYTKPDEGVYTYDKLIGHLFNSGVWRESEGLLSGDNSLEHKIKICGRVVTILIDYHSFTIRVKERDAEELLYSKDICKADLIKGAINFQTIVKEGAEAIRNLWDRYGDEQ